MFGNIEIRLSGSELTERLQIVGSNVPADVLRDVMLLVRCESFAHAALKVRANSALVILKSFASLCTWDRREIPDCIEERDVARLRSRPQRPSPPFET